MTGVKQISAFHLKGPVLSHNEFGGLSWNHLLDKLLFPKIERALRAWPSENRVYSLKHCRFTRRKSNVCLLSWFELLYNHRDTWRRSSEKCKQIFCQKILNPGRLGEGWSCQPRGGLASTGSQSSIIEDNFPRNKISRLSMFFKHKPIVFFKYKPNFQGFSKLEIQESVES